jgi:hypothetical protein
VRAISLASFALWTSTSLSVMSEASYGADRIVLIENWTNYQ